MTNIGIIQARIDSSRLERKMISKIGNHKIIEWVILRCKKSLKLDNLILATSNERVDDPLIKIAHELDIDTFRGEKRNVINRVLEAAKYFNADKIVRICADNPFIDPEVIDDLVLYHETSKNDLDFNHSPKLNCKIADGLGAEIFSLKLLLDISNLSLTNSQKEHVTKYIWDNYRNYKIGNPQIKRSLCCPYYRFDIDTMSDLQRLDQFILDYNISTDSLSEEIIRNYKKFILKNITE